MPSLGFSDNAFDALGGQVGGRRGRLCLRRLALLGCVALLVAVVTWGCVAKADAASVLLGSDYLTTLPGTFFDFPGIGVVPLEGRPIGPGNTDTIVQRQEDANLPGMGSSDTIPIEMVALSLQSTAPVNIGGSFFDVFVELTPARALRAR